MSSVGGTRPGPSTSARVFSFDVSAMENLKPKHTHLISLKAMEDILITHHSHYSAGHKKLVSLTMLFCSQLESRWLRCEPPRPRLYHTLPDETVDLRRLTQQHSPAPHPPLPVKHAHQADVDPSLPVITIILKPPLLLLLLLPHMLPQK